MAKRLLFGFALGIDTALLGGIILNTLSPVVGQGLAGGAIVLFRSLAVGLLAAPLGFFLYPRLTPKRARWLSYLLGIPALVLLVLLALGLRQSKLEQSAHLETLTARVPDNAQPATSGPECWPAPREYHTALPQDVLARFHSISAPGDTVPPGEPVQASGSEFKFWLRSVSPDGNGGGGVVIDTGHTNHTVLLFAGINHNPSLQWLSPTLLYMRVPWGRLVSSDILFDAGRAEVVYHEAVIDGTIAWQQSREACFGRCPCAAPWPAHPTVFPDSQAASAELVGLLELPGVYANDDAAADTTATRRPPIPVHSAPMSQSRELRADIGPQDLQYRESGYEVKAAAVYERLGEWYRIKLGQDGPYGWIAPGERNGRFLPLTELLPQRLGYLNSNWNGQLWENPPATAVEKGQVRESIRHSFEQLREYPATVIATRQTDRGLWLKVQIDRVDPCSAASGSLRPAADKVLEEGWIPAYSATGKLTSWFYSRGC